MEAASKVQSISEVKQAQEMQALATKYDQAAKELRCVLHHLRTGCILACALRPQHHLKEARVKDLVEWMNSHGGGREGR